MTIDIHIGKLRILWNTPVVTALASYENATRAIANAIRTDTVSPELRAQFHGTTRY
jgi:hypothetical protein